MAHLHIRLLGEPRFIVDDAPWRWTAPPRTLPLLAALLLHPGPLSRVALAAAIWPDESPASARSKLRRHLYRLTKALPDLGVPWLHADVLEVAWNLDAPATVDVVEFARLAASPATAQAAAEYYRGELLAGHADDEWLIVERERLQSTFLQACYDGAAQARHDRRFADVAELTERILAVDGFREDALRLLMTARYESGDRSAALRSFDVFAQRLRVEMRLDPMPETVALRNIILANEALPAIGAGPAWSDSARRAAQLPFVGRSNELDQLRALWHHAARGSGSLVFVSGEPGIGKSRIVAELALEVESEGGRVLVGGTSNPEREPYQALIDALRRAISLAVEGDVEFVWLSALAGLLPEVHALVPNLPDVAELPADKARSRLLEAFARCFEALARNRPALLVLEDLHWANAAGIDALAVLARRLRAMPMLVVATFRSDESKINGALRAARRDLAREHRATTLPLRPLNRTDVEQLIAGLPALASAPGDLAPAVYARSEGNPLFVTQLLHGFEETGTLARDASEIASLRDVILGRVAALGPEILSVAQVAATVGGEFTVELVGAAGGWRDDEVLDALDALIECALVREAALGEFEYTFSHALIRAALYEASEPEQRTARHRRIAALLAKIHGDDPRMAGSVGEHWERAGEFERAGAAFLRASQAALDVYARDGAVAYARRARQHARDERAIFDARLLEAKALMRWGAAVEWDEAIRDLEALCEKFGSQERFDVLSLRAHYARQTADWALQRRMADALLELADSTGSQTWRLVALDVLAYTLGMTDGFDAAHEVFERALNLAVEIGDYPAIVRLKSRTIQSLCRYGRIEQAQTALADLGSDLTKTELPHLRIELAIAEIAIAALVQDGAWCRRSGERLLELARSTGDVRAEAFAHTCLAQAEHQEGDPRAMRFHYSEALVLFERMDDRRSRGVTFSNRGNLERELGHYDRALEDIDRAETIAEYRTTIDGACVRDVNRCEIALARGDIENARRLAGAAAEHAMNCREPHLVFDALVCLGTAQVRTGEIDAGLATLQEALEGAGDASERHRGDAICTVVETLLGLGRLDACAAHVADLEQRTRHPEKQRFPTRIFKTLAQYYRARGALGAAQAWNERGRAYLEERLARLELEEDRAAFAAVEFNAALLAAMPSFAGG